MMTFWQSLAFHQYLTNESYRWIGPARHLLESCGVEELCPHLYELTSVDFSTTDCLYSLPLSQHLLFYSRHRSFESCHLRDLLSLPREKKTFSKMRQPIDLERADWHRMHTELLSSDTGVVILRLGILWPKGFIAWFNCHVVRGTKATHWPGFSLNGICRVRFLAGTSAPKGDSLSGLLCPWLMQHVGTERYCPQNSMCTVSCI